MNELFRPHRILFQRWLAEDEHHQKAYNKLLDTFINKCNEANESCDKIIAALSVLLLADVYLMKIFEVLRDEPANEHYPNDFILHVMETRVVSVDYVDRLTHFVKRLPSYEIARVVRGVKQDIKET